MLKGVVIGRWGLHCIAAVVTEQYRYSDGEPWLYCGKGGVKPFYAAVLCNRQLALIRMVHSSNKYWKYSLRG